MRKNGNCMLMQQSSCGLAVHGLRMQMLMSSWGGQPNPSGHGLLTTQFMSRRIGHTRIILGSMSTTLTGLMCCLSFSGTILAHFGHNFGRVWGLTFRWVGLLRYTYLPAFCFCKLLANGSQFECHYKHPINGNKSKVARDIFRFKLDSGRPTVVATKIGSRRLDLILVVIGHMLDTPACALSMSSQPC